MEDVNEVPVIVAPDLHVSVSSKPGDFVGTPLLAFDPDENQQIAYRLLGNASRFEIHSNTGQIKAH